MAIIQTLLHYGSYLAAFYAVYLLAGSLAFGLVLWQKVYGKAPTTSRIWSRPRRSRRSHMVSRRSSCRSSTPKWLFGRKHY